MKRTLFFVFVLVTILLGTVSFSVNYAYSKESTPVEEQEVKTTKSNKDSDENKIVDALDEELKDKSDDYRRDVIAMIKLPDGQAMGKVKVLEKVLGEFNIKDVYSIIPGFSAKMSKKQINALAALSDTIQIEPDLEVHAFLDKSTTWFGVQNARIDFGVDGNADGNPATYSKDDVVIAVIDTGICANHLDLDSGKIIGWKDYVSNQAAPYDDNGHGCHVSSIATGEGQANPAYTGVAPGAALVGVKVLNSAGSGSTSTVVSGVNWVVQNKALYGIEIMNLSLGSSGCSNGGDSLSLAVNNAVSSGIIAVVAAGNSGPKTCTIASPGAAQNAVTVGAMADVGELGFSIASFSSRGPTLDNRIKPDVAAPGVSITAASRTSATGYTTLSGTSMATPFVAGVAALMLDANPSLTPSDVKNKIMNTAIDWGPAGTDVDYGAGRLDAYEAVSDASITSLGNIAAPAHTFVSDSLGGTGAIDTWSLNIVDTAYPLAIVMIMPSWTGSSSPDFDMTLKLGTSVIAVSDGTTRQETIRISPTTGTYTLEVNSFTGSGPYFVDISAGTAPPPPVANSQSVTTVEDTPIVITLTASDADGDPLTFSIVAQPANAPLLTITPIGPNSASVTYTPNLNYVGPDSFTFKVNDGSLDSNIATVNITVSPTQIFLDNFPSQTVFAKWTETNELDWRVKSPTEKQIPGYTSSNMVAHAHSCTSSAGCILTMTTPVNLNGFQSITLKFWRYVDNNLDNGEFLRVQVFDGANWITLDSWTNGLGDDDVWHQQTYDLSGYNNVNNFNLRFVSKESSSGEEVEIDDVLITGIKI